MLNIFAEKLNYRPCSKECLAELRFLYDPTFSAEAEYKAEMEVYKAKVAQQKRENPTESAKRKLSALFGVQRSILVDVTRFYLIIRRDVYVAELLHSTRQSKHSLSKQHL